MAVLSQAALDRYLPDLQADGTLIADTELVSRLPDISGTRLYGGSFTAVAAQELGRAIVANMVMLGFLAGTTGLVTPTHLREVVAKGVPAGTEELNLKALEQGLKMASSRAV
jgi:2-oxoglutarate ferredoxin oxidoreductase subunit gamma